MDGGSTDGAVALLRPLRRGLALRARPRPVARAQQGVAEADGEWIGWLNADEFYLPGRSRLGPGAPATDDVDVLFGDFAEVDADGALLRLVTNHD